MVTEFKKSGPLFTWSTKPVKGQCWGLLPDAEPEGNVTRDIGGVDGRTEKNWNKTGLKLVSSNTGYS